MTLSTFLVLLDAERPMIYTGGGVIWSEAAKSLKSFAKALGYPVTNTLMGLGGYPATDKQFVGMLGMHGTYEANMGMHECDVLFAVVNLARHLKVDPEKALGSANRKFERRFRDMESAITESGTPLIKHTLESLEKQWRAAKKRVG